MQSLMGRVVVVSAVAVLCAAYPAWAGSPKGAAPSHGKHVVHGPGRAKTAHDMHRGRPSHDSSHRQPGRHDHHRPSYHDHWTPRISLGFYAPVYHSHHVGCGHAGYFCEHCRFHSASARVFYDHVHLSHRVRFAAIPDRLTWSPVNLVFVFD